ncbi:MAG: hypothetical protein MK212_00810 [Saprospiraceae bacterium]|nr:hypothetical protein [Saprospiraceae bacterium]
MQIIGIVDFLLLPFFLIILYWIAFRVRRVRYANTVQGTYFIRAFTFRVIGAILTAFMYQYYYTYADTVFYYSGGSDIVATFYRSPVDAIEMFTTSYREWPDKIKSRLTLHVPFYHGSSILVARFAGFFGLFSFGSYFGMSLGITTLAFIGCWQLYRVFYDLYPHLHRPLAWAILYVPSICFWGTGVMKDPLTLAGLGFFVHGIYWLFIKRKRIIRPIFWIYLGTYLMTNIKVYIFLSIAPACILWVFMTYQSRIQNKVFRSLAIPIFIIIGGIGGIIILQQVGETFQQYALQNILDQASKTQSWITYSTDRSDGTGYTLGEFDGSIGSLLGTFPMAVNVSLFRPYLWEARKVIVLPSALEALFTFLFTLYVVYKIGVFYLFRRIITNPVVLFCMTFAIFFAFAVGFTSMNFGALARYKIPCLPFYFAALVILYFEKYPVPAKWR